MQYTIKNDSLTAVISDAGAELQSLKGQDGTEYLWQGDPAIWREHAPNLFPYIARMTEESYVLNGQRYSMKIHGFVKTSVLAAAQTAENAVTFTLEDSEETRGRYPFRFTYALTYVLDGMTLKIQHRVTNRSDSTMFFGIGGHPGFNVPLEEGLSFEDYFAEFEVPCHPSRVGFTPACFVSGQDALCPLEDDRRLHFTHDLFDDDAVVLKHAARCVSIRSEKGTKGVKVSYPQHQYIGFWHKPHMEAPYVCIEPWSSLPSRDGIVEDLSQQSDLVRLPAGETYENEWTVTVW